MAKPTKNMLEVLSAIFPGLYPAAAISPRTRAALFTHNLIEHVGSGDVQLTRRGKIAIGISENLLDEKVSAEIAAEPTYTTPEPTEPEIAVELAKDAAAELSDRARGAELYDNLKISFTTRPNSPVEPAAEVSPGFFSYKALEGVPGEPMATPETAASRWSVQQERIFQWFEGEPGNLVVRARAGTGKTTTILEGIDRAPEKKILLAAFNKSIATELQGKLNNPRAEAKTLHGLGFGFLRASWWNLRVDNTRGRAISNAVCGNQPDPIINAVTKAHTKVREIAPFADRRKILNTIAENNYLSPELEDLYNLTADQLATLVQQALEEAKKKTSVIDFADMIFLPLVHRLIRPTYDLVVIDECQDMSDPQIQIAMQACRPNGRIAVVGDDRQAIYGFRGADSGSLNRLKRELLAQELGLTITYRCPRKVVAEAAKLVPDYTAAPTAIEGSIEAATKNKLIAQAKEGDFVLSRNNASLVSICIALLKEGKRARIKGRDIGASLLSRLRALRINNLGELSAKIQRWVAEEMQRVVGLEEEIAKARIDAVSDQADLFLALSEGLSSVGELEARIQTLFVDDAERQAICCSTVHKAKGLETQTVYLLEWTFQSRKRKGRENAAPSIEEQNLRYVALTRTKDRLVLVSEE